MRKAGVPIDRLNTALQARPEVVFAYLFGSSYAGPKHRLSDVDVAVYVESAAGEGREATRAETGLWTELIGDIQTALGRDDVDVVLLHRAPPLLAERVIRTGTVIFSRDEPLRISWVVQAKSRYCDLRSLHRMLDAAVSDRVRSGRFGYHS